jgi:hypothetical protein
MAPRLVRFANHWIRISYEIWKATIQLEASQGTGAVLLQRRSEFAPKTLFRVVQAEKLIVL